MRVYNAIPLYILRYYTWALLYIRNEKLANYPNSLDKTHSQIENRNENDKRSEIRNKSNITELFIPWSIQPQVEHNKMNNHSLITSAECQTIKALTIIN